MAVTNERPGAIILKPAVAPKDRLLPNQILARGSRLTSQNDFYVFVFQTDGNTVLGDRNGRAIWSPGIVNRGGVKAIMQADGNFVVYNGANQPVWSTGTQGRPGAYLLMQNDGNLVVVHNGRAAWESRTHGGTYHAVSSGSPFAAIASTLGGAAKGLASGVAVAAKFSGKAFTEVTKSPLWKVGAMVAPFALPGIGLAVSAGMMTAAAIGKAGSVKDAIIGAVRANLPENAKSAFDVGTGIAIHGEGIDEAGLKFIRDQIPPGEAKAAFDSALSLHVGRATAQTPAPANLSAQAKGAFYTTKGLVKIKAPPAMKKAVAQTVITNPDAHKGLQAAISSEVGISWLEFLWQEMKHAVAKGRATLVGRPVPKTIITTRGEVVS